MMQCGHIANAVCREYQGFSYDPPIPACVICTCIETMSESVDLTARQTRCVYYGQIPTGRLHESNHGCKRGEPCMCEEPSSNAPDGRLAFFEYRPLELHDRFYCGCWGWD